MTWYMWASLMYSRLCVCSDGQMVRVGEVIRNGEMVRIGEMIRIGELIRDGNMVRDGAGIRNSDKWDLLLICWLKGPAQV